MGAELPPLLTLAGLAVTMPLLDHLGRRPDFFVSRSAGPGELVLLAALLTALPALACAVALLPLRGGGEATRRRAAQLLAAPLAAMLFLVLGLARADMPGGLALALALAGGAGVAGGLARWPALATFLGGAFPAVLLLPLHFLALSPASSLVWPESAAALEVPGRARPIPVVLLVLDELPTSSLLDAEGALDTARLPAFGALAGTATWFREATSNAVQTGPAVTGLLTGKLPRPVDPAIASRHPENLFRLLAGSHEVLAFETYTRLGPGLPPDLRPVPEGLLPRLAALLSDVGMLWLHEVLPRRLRAGLPTLEGRWADFAGTDRIKHQPEELLERFLRAHQQSRKPGFWYLHLSLPHRPWTRIEDGSRYREGDLVPPFSLRTDAGEARAQLQAHLRQLGYTDRLLARVRRRLEEIGAWDPALVVLVADHGLSFEPVTSLRDTSERGAPDVLSVPFFLKLPGQQRGRIDPGLAQLVDVAPTVAAALGLELPWKTDGRSLLETLPQPRRRRALTPRSVRTEVPADLAARARRRARERGWLPPGSPLDPARLGPNGDLVGTRPGTDWTPVESALEANGPRLSAWLSPRGDETGAELLLTIDGVVRAAPRAYRVGERLRVQVILSAEDTRREGERRLWRRRD